MKNRISIENQIKLFKSGKLDGLRRSVKQLIARLAFARDMRSIELWNQYSDEAAAICRALVDGLFISEEEAEILYYHIIESAKRRSL